MPDKHRPPAYPRAGTSPSSHTLIPNKFGLISGKWLWRRANGGCPHSRQGRSLPGKSSPWQSCARNTPGCPEHSQRRAGMRFQHSLCLSALLPTARQLLAAGKRPGIWGERGVLDSCRQAKNSREAPRWPLPFPARPGQEHELLLWHRAWGSGATCPSFPRPQGPQKPPKPAQRSLSA